MKPMELKNYKNLFKVLFILPLINNKNTLSLINTKLNIYAKDTNKPHWEDKIILCYKNGGNFNKVRNLLENNEFLYEKYTEFTDDYYTIYSFIIPNEFKKDYEHLLNGEYTKLSQKAMNKIKGAWYFSDTLSNYISDIFIGLHSRIKTHPKLYDVLNLNQVPI